MAKKDDDHLLALCENCGEIVVAYDDDGTLSPIGPPDRACTECGGTEFAAHPLQDEARDVPSNAGDGRGE